MSIDKKGRFSRFPLMFLVGIAHESPWLKRSIKLLLPSPLVSFAKRISHERQTKIAYLSLEKVVLTKKSYNLVPSGLSGKQNIKNILFSGRMSNSSSHLSMQNDIFSIFRGMGIRVRFADIPEQSLLQVRREKHTPSSNRDLMLAGDLKEVASNQQISFDGSVLSENMPAPDLEIRCQEFLNLSRLTGKVKALHYSGRIESSFPQAWVEEINENLDFVSLSSHFSAKSLRDRGVVCPIFITGVGDETDAEKSAKDILTIAEYAMERKGKKRGRDYTTAWISTWNTRCGIATYSENLSMAFPKDKFIVLANKDPHVVRSDESFVRRVWTPTSKGLASLLSEISLLKPQALVVQHQSGQFGVDWLVEILLLCQKIESDSYLFLHNPKEVFDYCKDDIGLVRRILGLPTRVFVHRASDLSLLEESRNAENLVLFPHGVYFGPGESSSSRPENSPLRSKRVVACFGFLLPHKGVLPLVEAIHSLLDKIPNVHLLLLNSINDDPKSLVELHRLESLLVRLKMGNHVTRIHHFLDEVEILSHLKNAEVIVYPYQSSNESSSGAVKMGIAAGRPIAVTPLPVFEDIPKDVAYRLPGVSPDKIAEGLQFLMLDQNLQRSLVGHMAAYREERRWDALSERLLHTIQGNMIQKDFFSNAGGGAE